MISKSIKEYTLISIGAIMIAISLSVFFEPNGMVTGGATGLSIVIAYFARQVGLELSLGLLNLIINVPLFLIGFKIFGFKFLAKTIYATVFLSIVLLFTEKIPTVEVDLFLSAVFGGALTGTGVGLVFKCFATTGGSDLAASIIHNFVKHQQVSKIIFVIDAVIVAIGLLAFGIIETMYAIISIFIASYAIDAILEGLSFSKAALIISEKSEEISAKILMELERGATSLYGKGLYTGEKKDIIICVVSKKEIIKLKELSYNIDKSVFIIVADVREVLGEGFQQPVSTNNY